MGNFSRRTKWIVGFVVVVAAGYGLFKLVSGESGVPQPFTDARLQGAIIAQNIVNASNQSTATLEQISTLDQKGDYKDALTLAEGLVAQSADIRNQAVSLSSEISTMAQSLSGISNFTAQQAALESISNRLALLNELITYSSDLATLEATLAARFSGTQGTGAQVTTLVNQINTDVNAINNFNSQAGQAMDRFDTIVGK